jgi:transcriptional regulator with XRE-family HTH domain
MNLEYTELEDDELSLFYKMIGTNVKTIRAKKGITQMQLALAIGHNSVGHIAKAELNKYDKHFSIQNLYKIAKVLDVQICEFFVEDTN